VNVPGRDRERADGHPGRRRGGIGVPSERTDAQAIAADAPGGSATDAELTSPPQRLAAKCLTSVDWAGVPRNRRARSHTELREPAKGKHAA
jgi:hypothetical protein